MGSPKTQDKTFVTDAGLVTSGRLALPETILEIVGTTKSAARKKRPAPPDESAPALKDSVNAAPGEHETERGLEGVLQALDDDNTIVTLPDVNGKPLLATSSQAITDQVPFLAQRFQVALNRLERPVIRDNHALWLDRFNEASLLTGLTLWVSPQDNKPIVTTTDPDLFDQIIHDFS